MRVPSYDPKKKVWFCRRGPPAFAPNWLKVSCGRPVAKWLRAFSASLRWNSHARPLKSLVPERVWMLMTAPLPRPYSEAKFAVCTCTSSTDSRLGTIAGSPELFGLLFIAPSST